MLINCDPCDEHMWAVLKNLFPQLQDVPVRRLVLEIDIEKGVFLTATMLAMIWDRTAKGAEVEVTTHEDLAHKQRKFLNTITNEVRTVEDY